MNKTKKRLLLILIAFMLIPTLITPIETHAKDLTRPNLIVNDKGKVDIANSDGKVTSKATNFTNLITKYRVIIAGISGVGAVSMILFFIIGFMKLGATSANPEKRSLVILGLVTTGIAATGLGAVAFITGIFFNAL